MKVWNWLKQPPLWFLCIIYSLCILAVGITLTCVIVAQTAWYSIIAYAIAAILLFYTVYSIVLNYKRFKEFGTSMLRKNKIASNAIDNYGFRTVLFSTATSTINIAYTIFTVCIAILGHSIWYGALAIYYMALTMIRIYVLVKGKKTYDSKQELKIYKTCGILLIVLTFALSAAVLQMVIYKEGFRYAEIMVIAVAAFSFYKLGLAIYNIIKAKKYKNYFIQSLRNINLSSALVTLLALQTALISAYGGEYDITYMNAATGGLVCFGIVALGVYMIRTSNRVLKEGSINE